MEMTTATLAVVVIAAACGGANPSSKTLVVAPPANARPQSCDRPMPAFDVPAALADRSHPCHAWVAATSGRVFAQTLDSAVIWTTRTKHHTGVLVSAMHTLDGGFFGPAGHPLAQRVLDPAHAEQGTPRLFAPTATGGFATTYAALWPLYVPEVPADETRGKLEDILPRHDFFLAAVDGQVFQPPAGIAPAAGRIQPRALSVLDAVATTTSNSPTAAASKPGDVIELIGVPRHSETASAAIARVLDAREVADAQALLRAAHDEEGEIAYDPEAELFVEGDALPGMSGGGAFDRDGRLVGVIVRGSVAKGANGLPFARILRATYIAAQVRTAVARLPAAERAAVVIWLGELD